MSRCVQTRPVVARSRADAEIARIAGLPNSHVISALQLCSSLEPGSRVLPSQRRFSAEKMFPSPHPSPIPCRRCSLRLHLAAISSLNYGRALHHHVNIKQEICTTCADVSSATHISQPITRSLCDRPSQLGHHSACDRVDPNSVQLPPTSERTNES